MMRQSLSNDRLPTEATARFRVLAEDYCLRANIVGIECNPYRDAQLPIFSKATPGVQTRAITFLENALAVFEDASAQRESLLDNRKQIWRQLSQLKFVPSAGIFEKIEDSDVVEIFSIAEESHVAWNLRLFEFISFTIEQLLCIPWWELASRPPEIVTLIQDIVGKIASNQITETLEFPIPTHVFMELDSEHRMKVEVNINYVSPLKQNGQNVGFLSITRGRELL